MKVDQLPEISDTEMRERLAGTRDYTLMILKTTPKTFTDEGRPVIWEHGRRNMALRAAARWRSSARSQTAAMSPASGSSRRRWMRCAG